ncbi:MAG: T9SS type A sorting domain-containing protein [Bacteroidetes bacterium]|nr:T9SS type A sorting domain-containing protein [Bacteroidota bacterium]
MRTPKILILFLLSGAPLCGQELPTEGLFEFNSIFQQKNIRVSDRIKEDLNLQGSFIQQTYYNANKDTRIDSIQPIRRVSTIQYFSNGDQNVLQLLDDGSHFDDGSSDAIYGNVSIGEFDRFRTDESTIDVQLDTMGINYFMIYPRVTYLPEPPTIIIPQNSSTVSSTMPQVAWRIDPRADGAGVILLAGAPVLGEKLKGVIWQESFAQNGNSLFTEKLPFKLENKKEYTLIIWSYTNTKVVDGVLDRAAYSMEWSRFRVDTSLQNGDLVLLQNFPNPFSSVTFISYVLPKDGDVSIKIFDVLGNQVATLVHEKESQGEHYAVWCGQNALGCNVGSGVYLYNLIFDHHSRTGKLLLLR